MWRRQRKETNKNNWEEEKKISRRLMAVGPTKGRMVTSQGREAEREEGREQRAGTREKDRRREGRPVEGWRGERKFWLIRDGGASGGGLPPIYTGAHQRGPPGLGGNYARATALSRRGTAAEGRARGCGETGRADG